MNSAHVRAFQSQEILCPDTEPHCIAASDGIFWVASPGLIRGYSTHTTSTEFHKLYEFSPLWPNILSIHYLPHLKRVVTLEQEENYRICRIYSLNWDQKSCRTNIMAYYLPAGTNVKTLSVCQFSNSIMVCLDNGVITVWSFDHQIRKKLIKKGLPTCLVKIHTPWNIHCISIFKNFIGYGSESDIRIIRLVYHHQNHDHHRSHSSNQENESRQYQNEQKDRKAIDSLVDVNGLCVYWGISQVSIDLHHLVEVRFNTETQDLLPSSASKPNIQTASNSFSQKRQKKSLSKQNDVAYHILGESPNIDHPTFVNKDYIDTCVNLIHKHFKQEETPKSIHFIRTISTKQEFLEKSETSGMKCIMTTSSKGYAYDISCSSIHLSSTTTNPSRNSSIQVLSEYEFCGECIISAANSYFLFAVTQGGMEVWSVLGSSSGCLLRFHPFIGLKSICTTNSHTLLLSKFSNDENISLAAYYNPSHSSNMTVLSDIRNIDKLNTKGSKGKGSVIPLFTGSRRKAAPTAQKTPQQIVYSYNVYVLRQVEICEVYEDLLEKAMDLQTSEPEKHIKLLKEGHTLLQSKYYELLSTPTQNDIIATIRLQLEQDNYTNLLEKSFGILGDVYCTHDSSDHASQMYVQSDRTLAAVMKKLDSRPQSLMNYLEHVIFDKSRGSIFSHQSNQIGNKILELYGKYLPEKIGSLILESNLFAYSSELAIKLLEKITGKKSTDDNQHKGQISEINENAILMPPEYEEYSRRAVQPKDAIALGLLHLDVGDVAKCIQSLESIDSHCIIEFIVSQPELLNFHEKRSKYNSTQKENGKNILISFLRQYYPWCLLEIIIRLRCIIAMNDALIILQSSQKSYPSNEILQELYLTSVILDASPSNSNSYTVHNNPKISVSSVNDISTNGPKEENHEDQVNNAVKLLLSLFVKDLLNVTSLKESDPGNQSSNICSGTGKLLELSEWCSFLQYSFVSYRHSWLDSVHDHEESSSMAPENQIEDESSQLNNPANIEEMPMLENPSDMLLYILCHPSEKSIREKFILHSAQGLLCYCSNHMITGISFDDLLGNLIEQNHFHGKLSLQVLCLTATQQYETAFDMMLKMEPSLCFEFAKQHLSFSIQNQDILPQWKIFLGKLMIVLREREGELQNDSQIECVASLFEKTLWYLASNLDPEIFVGMLPPDGNFDFFLPFISHSFSHKCAVKAKKELQKLNDTIEQ